MLKVRYDRQMERLIGAFSCTGATAARDAGAVLELSCRDLSIRELTKAEEPSSKTVIVALACSKPLPMSVTSSQSRSKTAVSPNFAARLPTISDVRCHKVAVPKLMQVDD